MSLAAAMELKPKGVAISVVCPDAVDTAMFDDQIEYDEAALTFSSEPLTTEEVVRVVVDDVAKTQRLEAVVAKRETGRAITARFASAFPEAAARIGTIFSKKKGLKLSRRFERGVGEDPEEVDMQYPEISYLNHFDGARDAASPAKRLDAICGRAQELRDELLAGPKVLFYETFDLIRVPYPTKYGFLNACSVPTPFLHIVNKMFVIQVNSVAGVKTVLVSPSDTVGNAETPVFSSV